MQNAAQTPSPADDEPAEGPSTAGSKRRRRAVVALNAAALLATTAAFASIDTKLPPFKGD